MGSPKTTKPLQGLFYKGFMFVHRQGLTVRPDTWSGLRLYSAALRGQTLVFYGSGSIQLSVPIYYGGCRAPPCADID